MVALIATSLAYNVAGVIIPAAAEGRFYAAQIVYLRADCSIICAEYCYCCRHTNVVDCLFQFYVLATCSVISCWILTGDSAYLWWLYIVVPLGDHISPSHIILTLNQPETDAQPIRSFVWYTKSGDQVVIIPIHKQLPAFWSWHQCHGGYACKLART